MSDELIAEAQEHYSEMNGLNSRAAEVMMELVAALEAKTGVRVDMSSAVGVETQLATRVPVQGEPNDDRGALAALIEEQEEYPHPRGYLGHADLILAAGFSRAAVPDAATEAQVEAAAKAMWDLRKRESEPEWGELEHGVKQEYRKDARAAIMAAFEVKE